MSLWAWRVSKQRCRAQKGCTCMPRYAREGFWTDGDLAMSFGLDAVNLARSVNYSQSVLRYYRCAISSTHRRAIIITWYDENYMYSIATRFPFFFSPSFVQRAKPRRSIISQLHKQLHGGKRTNMTLFCWINVKPEAAKDRRPTHPLPRPAEPSSFKSSRGAPPKPRANHRPQVPERPLVVLRRSAAQRPLRRRGGGPCRGGFKMPALGGALSSGGGGL